MVNIFFTNIDPIIAARESPDQYVVKIPIEIGLLLSALHWREFAYVGEIGSGNELEYIEIDGIKTLIPAEGPYRDSKVIKSTSKIYQWLKRSKGNYKWAIEYGLELVYEYQRRYHKLPKTLGVLLWLEIYTPDLPNLGLTMDVGLSMPQKYQDINDPVTSYKKYILGEKSHILKWRYTSPPEWYTNDLSLKNP